MVKLIVSLEKANSKIIFTAILIISYIDLYGYKVLTVLTSKIALDLKQPADVSISTLKL